MVVGPESGYVRIRNGAYRVRSVGTIQVRFIARNWRPERTGFHARVDIEANGRTLAFDTFNVERDGERTKLANSAYAKLIGGRPSRERPELAGYPLVFMQDDIDQFCDGLRDVYIEDTAAERMDGALERIELDFILRPYLMRRGGTICFAPPGHGKSYVLWTMAVCIDAGLSEFWPVQQTRVLVINLERSRDTVQQRLGNINEVLGFDRNRPLDVINARGKTLQDVALTAQRHVDRMGVGCIMLDSLSRAGSGNLNDNDIVNAYCNTLNSFGVAWFALGHSPRGDASHLFGSQMFDAAADLMVRLTAQEKLQGPLGIALDLDKRNDIGKQPMWVGAFEFDGKGLTHIRTARPGEFHELETGEKMGMEDRVALRMARMGAMSATQLADDLGYTRQSISELIANNDRFTFVRKEGRNVLYGLRAPDTSGHPTHTRHVEPWWNDA